MSMRQLVVVVVGAVFGQAQQRVLHGRGKGKKLSKTSNIPFLVYNDGKEFNKINSITRILNKIFDKKIGSSMLRHIFLTDKYIIIFIR